LPPKVDDSQPAALAFAATGMGKAHLPQSACTDDYVATFWLPQELDLKPSELVVIEVARTIPFEGGQLDE
jgi:uncharacterized protein YcnI